MHRLDFKRRLLAIQGVVNFFLLKKKKKKKKKTPIITRNFCKRKFKIQKLIMVIFDIICEHDTN
jgi:hypothetical protein